MDSKVTTLPLNKVGQVRVDRLPNRMSGEKWPVLEGFACRVNCTSGAPGLWKQLSPMKLGPIVVKDWGWKSEEDVGEQVYNIPLPKEATNLENLWQASKVWNGEEDGKYPSKDFFQRRSDIWQDSKAYRWIKKKVDSNGNKNVTLYSLWGTQKLSYIQSRKFIYCPIYADLVVKTKAYQKLKKKLNNGENILLLEYDGYDRGTRSLHECFNDVTKPFGHGLVLECLLTDIIPWKE